MVSGLKQVDLAIQAVMVASEQLALCKTRESELDFARQAVKSEAISRIMAQEDPQKPGKLYSATAAADIVSSDKAFALFEHDRRMATADTIKAMGAYKAACFRAELAVKGSDLALIDEEPVQPRFGDNHAVTVR